MNRWRFPTLSLHGIEGAYADQGGKTVIPRQVIGKFSLRIVPSQTPEQIEKVRDRRLKKLRKKMADKQKENKQAPDQSEPPKEKPEKSSSITSPKRFWKYLKIPEKVTSDDDSEINLDLQ